MHAFGLVYRAPDLVILALERGIGLFPHGMEHLQGFTQHAQPLRTIGEGVAVGLILLLVPAGADAEVEASVAQHVDGRGHLSEQSWGPVAVAGHHLAYAHPGGLAGQGRRGYPALEIGFQGGRGHGVEVVVQPYGVEPEPFGFGPHPDHGGAFFDGDFKVVAHPHRQLGQQAAIDALRDQPVPRVAKPPEPGPGLRSLRVFSPRAATDMSGRGTSPRAESTAPAHARRRRACASEAGEAQMKRPRLRLRGLLERRTTLGGI